MKTLTPTNLIAVEVPKEAEDFQIIVYADKKKALLFIVNQPGYYETGYRNLGQLYLEILGEVTDTEISFDVEPYLKYDTVFINGMHRFRIYTDLPSGNTFDKNESFRSLLQSNGIVIREGYKYIILNPTNQN